MKLAAIDIGSNSVHMVVVEVSARGAFAVIGREKEMVRLGEHTLARGRLSASAMERGLSALAKFRRLAENHGVERVLAVATSAVREAANGEQFLERVRREVGIWPRVVSGEVEGRLIYLAALHSVHLEGRRALVVDIGGGSVELVLGAGEQVLYAVSEKIGVLRMRERFMRDDPVSPREEALLAAHVKKALEPHLPALRRWGFDQVVGTSGTILAVGAVSEAAEGGAPPDSLHHLTIRAEAVHAARKRVAALPLRARRRLPGLDEGRADIIVPGAIILDTILERVGARGLVLCDWALREGLLLDYIRSHPGTLARAEAYPDVRRRSVVELAERCQYDEVHAAQVARLALRLFDLTRARHGLDAAARGLLEYAALLHDIGHHISYPRHHRHTYYLVRNGDLRGFGPREIDLLALVARYHRRAVPRRRHPEFAALSPEEQQQVRVLAGLLRLAEALDRGHRQVVTDLTVSGGTRRLRVELQAEGDCEMELWAAKRRRDLLQDVLGVRLSVSPAPVPAAVAEAGAPA